MISTTYYNIHAYWHILSPISYIIFVKLCQHIVKPYSNHFRLTFRKFHNIFMSLLSFIILIGITYGTWQESKFNTIYDLFCKSYNRNVVAEWSAFLFVWSKYIEWIDTLLLIMFNKYVSWLQYTHHATTGIICWYNFTDNGMYQLTPYTFFCVGLNAGIHILMYWYFAYPKGFLSSYSKLITCIQLFQHLSCMIITGLTLFLFTDSCTQNFVGNILLFFGYVHNFSFFLHFYIHKYIKNNKNIKTD